METKENVFLEDVHRVFHPQVPGKPNVSATAPMCGEPKKEV